MLGFIEMMERFYTQMLSVPKPQIATAIKLGAQGAQLPARCEEEGLEANPMRSQVAAFKAPLHSPGSEPELGDLRFRALLGEADWAALPLPIRRRFSKRLAGGDTAVYTGEVIETQMSRAGWWLAQAARLIGGPLPLSRDAHAPSVVTVTEDVATRGQHWTRLYARRHGFPQVVHSSKRFAGPTGLEEYVGCGVGMALTIHVEERRADLPRRALFPPARPLAPAPAATGSRPARSP